MGLGRRMKCPVCGEYFLAKKHQLTCCSICEDVAAETADERMARTAKQSGSVPYKYNSLEGLEYEE